MEEEKDILLAKWLSGELSEKEIENLKKDYDLKALSGILDAQQLYVPETVDADIMWQNIVSQKGLNEENETNLKTPNSNKRPNKTKIFLILFVLACILATTLFILGRNSNTVIQTKNQIATEQLFANGSMANIGPNSRISFSSTKWEDNREVQLSGQAFFYVTSGQAFSVITSAGKVDVLGTQFDVWNIHPNYMRVSCKEGKVKVTDNKGSSKIITASQYVYIVDDEITEIETTSSTTADWQGNFRNYKTTPMSIVLSDLERFYSVKFEMEDSIAQDLFSGVLPINNLNKCVQYIETSLSYESKRENDSIIFMARN